MREKWLETNHSILESFCDAGEGAQTLTDMSGGRSEPKTSVAGEAGKAGRSDVNTDVDKNKENSEQGTEVSAKTKSNQQ